MFVVAPASILPQKRASSCEGDKDGFLQGWIFLHAPIPPFLPMACLFISLLLSTELKRRALPSSFPNSLLSLNTLRHPLKSHHSPKSSPVNAELQTVVWAIST